MALILAFPRSPFTPAAIEAEVEAAFNDYMAWGGMRRNCIITGINRHLLPKIESRRAVALERWREARRLRMATIMGAA